MKARAFGRLGVILLAGVAAFAQEAPPPAKAPLPDAAAVKEARKLAHEVYGAEIAAARKPEDKAALGRKLLQAAADARSDPAGRYVLLGLAGDMGAGGGDVETAFAAVEELARSYQVDGWKAKAATAVRLVAGRSADGQALTERMSRLVDEAIAADRYDVAEGTAEQAVVLARRGRDPGALRAAVDKVQEVRAVEGGYAQAKKALATLAQDPNNTSASLAAGRFFCLIKGDWAKGLPMLATGSDKALQALAVKELASPGEADAQVQVADAWWEAAANEQGLARNKLREHAADWYKKALPGLTGLLKTKAEKRIAEVQNVSRPAFMFRPEQWGVFTWDGSLWRPQSLGRMTVRVSSGVLTAVNTTGVHTLAGLYRKQVLARDFVISLEYRGSCCFSFFPPDGRDASWHTSGVSAQEWQRVVIARQRGKMTTVLKSANASTNVRMEGPVREAESAPCLLTFQIPSNATLEIRNLSVVSE